MLPIHQELAKLAGKYPAGFLKTSALARVTYDRVEATVNLLKGKVIKAGNGELSARLKDATWSKKPSIVLAPSGSPTANVDVDIVPSADLTVVVEIVITAAPTELISTVEVKLTDLRVHVRAENNLLVVEGAEYKSNAKMTREKDADKKLKKHNIDPVEAAYVEGLIGYGIVAKAISQTISQRSEIPLADLFPAVDFGKTITLKILVKGAALGIVPTEKVTLRSTSRCVCDKGPDFKVKNSTIKNVIPPSPKKGDKVAELEIGGPIADNKDPLKDFGIRNKDKDGIAGLYIPKEFASALVVEPMPAIKLVAQDRGFIGYRASLSCGFKDFDVTFDIKGGGIVLTMKLDISGSGFCDVDLMCFRLPIAWVAVQPIKDGTLEIGFYPSIDDTGGLRLKGTLRKNDPGSYVAVVTGVGTVLSFFTAGLGLLIDVALAVMLTSALPAKIKEQIANYMGSKEWEMAEILPLVDPTRSWSFSAPFDVDAVDKKSLLASVDVEV